MKKSFSLVSLIGISLLLFITNSVNAQVGHIIWEENFNSLDTTRWNIVEGDGCPEMCGWGNNELEYYSKNNVRIEEVPGETDNYALVFEAKKENLENSQFTSGKISSENKIGIKYGMVEMRIKVPNDISTGLWPAAWLLGTNLPAEGWPACGEIDMMEMGQSAQFRSDKGLANYSENDIVGANLLFFSDEACSSSNPDCAASIAYDNYYCKPYRGDKPLTERFLIYRLYWDEKAIRFTVEDEGLVQNLYTGPFPIGSDSKEFQKPFYFILNLAVGGTFTDAATASQVTAAMPGKMLIDYIRVRKWNGKGEVFTPEKLMANAGADKKVGIGESVFLNAMGSYGPITNYTWTINDSIIATGMSATVQLPTGTHEINLNVADADGNTATDIIVIDIGGGDIGEVIWQEDFNNFDTTKWNTIIGNGCDEGLCGWGNNELQYYNNDNIYVEELADDPGNFALVLEARNQQIGESLFTSGKVTTENKLAIKYGVVEVKMKVPNLEKGLWPAAWLLGVNHETEGWPQCGEIDMMEMGHAAAAREKEGFFGSSNNFVGANLLWYSNKACSSNNLSCAASIAYDAYYNTPYTSSTGMNNRYMIYRMYWDESEIRFTAIDNGTEHDLYTNPFPISSNEDAFQKPFYFLLDLAVGGNFTGLLNPTDITAPLPAKMYVDYIKVSKWRGKGEVAYAGGSLLANAGSDITICDDNKDGKALITLNGLGSYGNITSFYWSEAGAQIASGATPTLELATGTHYINLTIADENGASSTDEVRVDIREIIWEENFNAFDTTLWNTIEGDGCPELCGWGNSELEYYTNDNISINEIEGEAGNYALAIEAKKEARGSSHFTSGKISTQNKVNIKYGLMEVRMKAPDDLATGLWPAAWLLGANITEMGWPACGEIDMMEMGQTNQFRYDKGFTDANENDIVGANLIFYSDDACSNSNPTCAASIAHDNYYCKPYKAETPLTNRFLIYRTYWDQNQIRLTAEDNGVEYDLYTGPFPLGRDAEEFHKPFYFLLNLAVGGNFTDATTPDEVTALLPGKMLVDYIKVMKWNGKGEVSFASGLVANGGADVLIIDADGDGKETVILDASESADHNGNIVGYSWLINGSEIATGKLPEIELNRGTYHIKLTITDNDGNTAEDEVIVLISSGGLAPIANAGNDTTVYDTNADDMVTLTLDGSKSEASNTPIIKYAWFIDSTEIALGSKPTIDLSTGIYKITLLVMDEDSLTGTDDVIVTVIDPTNIAPIANAGNTITVVDHDGDDLEIITLDGSASNDSDGSIEKYSWLVNNNKIAEGINPSVELSTGQYLITLQIMDNDGAMAFAQVSATIIDPDNIAPNAQAGKDSIIIDADMSGSQKYNFDGSASTDSDGVIENYTWLENGLIIGSGKKPAVDLLVGLHKVVLEVADDDGDKGYDTVLVKVNQLPIANAGNDSLYIDTDENGTELVTLNGSESYDPDGSIKTYLWLENDLELATGETAAYAFIKGTHQVTLIVTDDDGFTNSDAVTIVMASLNNLPPIANAGDDITQEDYDNNGLETIVLNGLNSTDADGSIFSYKWFEGNEEIASGPNPSVILTTNEHTVVLEVTDNEGAKSTDEVTINITPSACMFEACTGDYTAKIISNDEGTSIKFIPKEFGIGESMCLLYYGTSDPMPGSSVIPYQAVKLNGVSSGQNIYFYYTYNTNSTDQTTANCKHSFIVGSCNAMPNSDPIANAGPNQTVYDVDNNGSETVTLNGLESYDPDGSIEKYVWIENNRQVSKEASTAITLNRGNHTIYLLVTDNHGNISRDKVSIEVKETTSIANRTSDDNIIVYPIPVNNMLYVKSDAGKIEKLCLYNAQGIRIDEISQGSGLNMTDYKKGIYIIEITLNGTVYKRIVIK